MEFLPQLIAFITKLSHKIKNLFNSFHSLCFDENLLKFSPKNLHPLNWNFGQRGKSLISGKNRLKVFFVKKTRKFDGNEFAVQSLS